MALEPVDADAKDSSRFTRSFNEIKEWDFTNVEVLEYNEPYVDVKFEILIYGKSDSGTDQAEVLEKDGLWCITDIPS